MTDSAPNPAGSSDSAASSLPVADVRRRESNGIFGLVQRSKFWWLTLLCVIVAAVLTWFSTGTSGPEIVIHFDEGHGIKAGDALRHRGIDVGQVVSVDLNADLSGIDVRVRLSSAAAGLARDGSRFWIVRPQLSLTAVSGLDTALGAKYIAVDPGELTGTQKREFDGLPAAPPDGLHHDGLELVLRGADRRGLSIGSPVTYRGIDVGMILAVQLSPDANGVDVRVRIDAPFRMLVRQSSRFWIVSGINFDVGLSGVEFSAESLASIARGGVAFLTPDSGEDIDVHSGQVYTLHHKLDPDWLNDAAHINLLEVPVHIATLRLDARWQQKRLGFTRERSLSGYGLVVSTKSGPQMIVPRDLVTPVSEALAESYALRLYDHAGGEVGKFDEGLQPVGEMTSNSVGAFSLPESPGLSGTRADQLRVPSGTESVLVVPDPKSTRVISLGEHQLLPGAGKWTVTTDESISDSWHGAPVVSTSDGKVIGVFIVQGGAAAVVPFTANDLPASR